MAPRSFVVLDFDGVLCDSIDECFVSSWLAYHRLEGLSLPSSLAVETRARFAALRPFIRAGEDYVLIQRLIAAGARIETQEEFDAKIAEEGAGGMERLKEMFYAARSGLLDSDRAYWLSLNRVYAHVRGPLASAARSQEAFVLSTKKSEFIVEILAANGIEIPIERVIYTGSRSKASIVESMLGPGDRALLIDDQIEHLLGPRDPRIEVRLALWGYVRKDWASSHPQMPALAASDFAGLVESWLTPRRPTGS